MYVFPDNRNTAYKRVCVCVQCVRRNDCREVAYIHIYIFSMSLFRYRGPETAAGVKLEGKMIDGRSIKIIGIYFPIASKRQLIESKCSRLYWTGFPG